MAVDKTLLAGLAESEAASVGRLLEKGVSIPPQPRVLAELQHLIGRGVSDVRVLARSITQDPGVTGLLFKVVQNAAYRRQQPFESVEHILQAIGINQTCNIIQAIAVHAALPAKHNQKAFEAFWARSNAIGQLAMLIAGKRVSVCNIFPDQAYLAGIFHDCGVPVLMQRFSSYCNSMKLEEPGCWADLAEEDARFNADHCVVGYLVGRHWKLPDFICDAIRFHHDIGRLENHTARTMVAILHLALQIYCLDQRIDNPEWPAAHDEVLSELGIYIDSLPEFIDDVLEKFHTAA